MRHAQEVSPVEVEVSLAQGLPKISFLGLPDPFIRESVSRIKSALKDQGFEFPKGQQVLVQLRPSHLKKTSRGLDLAVAAALLWETEQVKRPDNADSMFLYGELSLKGEVIVPDDVDDVEECLAEKDILVTGSDLSNFSGNVWSLENLKDLLLPNNFKVLKREEAKCTRPDVPYQTFSKKQADLISLLAAGGHTALFVGTPGSGKSATAECVNSFLPPPDREEWKSIKKVSSYFYKPISWRPNVVVHHSITQLAMVGGGSPIRPGEITRAHGGTLIMDELLEFKPIVQDSLREPLESGEIEIARQGRHRVLPAQFQLIATSNLCRCGNYAPGAGSRCRCSGLRLRQYQERFSGPVIDRFSVIGLFLEKEAREPKTIESALIFKNLERATSTRRARNQRLLNARLSLNEIEKNLDCSSDLIELFCQNTKSQRTKIQIMQVARTVADLNGSQKVTRPHFEKAAEFVVGSRESLLRSLEV